MCEALVKLMEPEMKAAINKAVNGAEENIVINALKAGNSVADISRIVQISIEEIETIAKGKQEILTESK